jgi:hypothetical protein
MADETSDKDERDRRRAAALRENLKRRKAQQRARTDQKPAAETPDEPAKP